MVVSRLMLGPVTIVSPYFILSGGQPPFQRITIAPVIPTPRLFYVWQNGGYYPQLVLQLPATRVRKGHQLRLILPGPDTPTTQPPQPDDKLLALLAEARQAQQFVLAHPNTSLARLATANKICRKRLGKLVALSCLAPEIVTALIEGSQPSGVTAAWLLEAELPLEWGGQRQKLGFS